MVVTTGITDTTAITDMAITAATMGIMDIIAITRAPVLETRERFQDPKSQCRIKSSAAEFVTESRNDPVPRGVPTGPYGNSLAAQGGPVVRIGFSFAFIASLFHMAMVFLGACHVPSEDLVDRLGMLGKGIVLYSAYSGANTAYSFFAPEIGSELRAFCIAIGPDGHEIAKTLITTSSSHEALIRVNNIVENFWIEDDNEDVRRSLAASLAGRSFSDYPQAEKITVLIEVFDLPSMADYRKGAPFRWMPYYSATFNRKTTIQGA